MDDKLHNARNSIEIDLTLSEIMQISPLDANSWVLSSLLQKSIRRNETFIAGRAALTYVALKGSAIWRRLMVIAFEDVGAGSTDALAKTVAAAIDPAWRKNVGGNTRVAVHVARMLAGAPKDRSADYLICGAKDHPSLEEARRTFGSSTIEQRRNAAANPQAPLTQRAMAAWYASGIEWDREKRVGNGNLPALLETFRHLGTPEDLVAATGIAAARTREPIVLMVPLVWLAANEEERSTIFECEVPPSPTVSDVPLYALDKHTRLGREAIGRFARENVAVRTCLERYVPERRRREAAYMAAFYADGAPVSRRLKWKQSEYLEAYGTENDLLLSGVKSGGVAPLLQIVRENLEHLNELRADVFNQTRRSPQNSAFELF